MRQSRDDKKSIYYNSIDDIKPDIIDDDFQIYEILNNDKLCKFYLDIDNLSNILSNDDKLYLNNKLQQDLFDIYNIKIDVNDVLYYHRIKSKKYY